MSKENAPSNQNKSKARTTKDTKEAYHHVADVSLRTSATMLTIIFAYTFAAGVSSSMEFKTMIVIIGLILFCCIITSIFCLFVKTEVGLIQGLGIASACLMLAGIVGVLALLVVALFGH
jgi:uncharacterized membrane protein